MHQGDALLNAVEVGEFKKILRERRLSTSPDITLIDA